jgi:hypothetical protein
MIACAAGGTVAHTSGDTKGAPSAPPGPSTLNITAHAHLSYTPPPPVRVPEEGPYSTGKSVFRDGEDIEQLVRAAEWVPPVEQDNGRYQRVVDVSEDEWRGADEPVGYDEFGNPEAVYTVITEENEEGEHELFDAFPGSSVGHLL